MPLAHADKFGCVSDDRPVAFASVIGFYFLLHPSPDGIYEIINVENLIGSEMERGRLTAVRSVIRFEVLVF